MRNIKLALLIFLSLIFSSGWADSICVCTIFRDETKYLQEWIDFHIKQGVSRFYLYNNLSVEDYTSVLKKYTDKGLVEVIDWPYQCKDGADWDNVYCSAYMDCLKRCKNYDWCAFLDTDEFLFTLDETPLTKFLKKYRAFPAVVANWVFYGTSNVECIPEGEKLVDHLVWRAPLDYTANQGFKIIAQPLQVLSCHNAHWFKFLGDRIAVDENKKPKQGSNLNSISVNKIRINHYWSRDKDFFHNVKLPRRMHFYNEYERCVQLESEMNSEYDPILRTK